MSNTKDIERLLDEIISTDGAGTGARYCPYPFYYGGRARQIKALLDQPQQAVERFKPSSEEPGLMMTDYKIGGVVKTYGGEWVRGSDYDQLAALAPKEPAQSLELALRNCYALARAKIKHPDRIGGWVDIVRFCEDGGLSVNPLRGGTQ